MCLHGNIFYLIHVNPVTTSLIYSIIYKKGITTS